MAGKQNIDLGLAESGVTANLTRDHSLFMTADLNTADGASAVRAYGLNPRPAAGENGSCPEAANRVREQITLSGLAT
jgi:hypothetical protein